MKKNEISFYKNLIDERIDEYFSEKLAKSTYNKLLYESMYYSMKNGGKRVRPLLFLLVYNVYKPNYMDYIDFALALEMIHCYSLIHDDLPCLDNDDMRRGRPTNHVAYGESVALLAGDALLNEAFELLFKLSIDDESCAKASYEVAKSTGGFGMIGGQIADILGENKILNEEELKYMHENKTGKLIKTSIISAGILCNLNQENLDVLNELGGKLGYAFQIKDDILDVIGDEIKLGKSINSDAKNNKSTFITLYGLDESKRMYNELCEECLMLLTEIAESEEALLLKFFVQELINRNN